MEIKKQNVEITHLIPKNGYYLTQANRKDDEEPILSKDVMLSIADRPENWIEISEADGEKMQSDWIAEMEKLMNK